MTQTIGKEKNSFISCPVILIENANNNQKTLSIPIKNTTTKRNTISKSWNGFSEKPQRDKKNCSTSPTNEDYQSVKRHKNNFNRFDVEKMMNCDYEYKPYDAMSNCKSAGIIPYTIYNGKLYFLLQKTKNPIRKKDIGWNDFGGKKLNAMETTADAAAREFSEETSCLFYLKEKIDEQSEDYYNYLKDNTELFYDEKTIEILKKLIPQSQKYYADKIMEYVLPIYVSSKETYISYFIKVDYIDENDLPKAEDLHIPYETRYIRTCKWFNFDELMELDDKDFHKRLQITRIKQRIHNYYEKGLFT